jgi:hypothetical protein
MKNNELVVSIYGYETYKIGTKIITDMGDITLEHLDNPSVEVIKARIDEAITEEDDCLDDECFLCQISKDQPYTLTYFDLDKELD